MPLLLRKIARSAGMLTSDQSAPQHTDVPSTARAIRLNMKAPRIQSNLRPSSSARKAEKSHPSIYAPAGNTF